MATKFKMAAFSSKMNNDSKHKQLTLCNKVIIECFIYSEE